MRIDTGNAINNSALDSNGTYNGWFVGSPRFIPESSLRQSDACEIKWSIHSRRYHSGIKPCAPGWGISILISGEFVIALRESPGSEWQEYRLSRQGDYFISQGGHSHWYRAETDCVLVTFRLTGDATEVRPSERAARTSPPT